MIDPQRAGPALAGAQNHDFMAEEFDAGRRRGTGREDRKIAADPRLGEGVALDLAERHRHAECRGGARRPHGFQGVGRDAIDTPPPGLGDPVRGQQRAFDLNEMDVGRVIDAGVAHRAPDAGRHHRDLIEATKVLGWEVGRVHPADRERPGLGPFRSFMRSRRP